MNPIIIFCVIGAALAGERYQRWVEDYRVMDREVLLKEIVYPTVVPESFTIYKAFPQHKLDWATPQLKNLIYRGFPQLKTVYPINMGLSQLKTNEYSALSGEYEYPIYQAFPHLKTDYPIFRAQLQSVYDYPIYSRHRGSSRLVQGNGAIYPVYQLRLREL